MESHEIRIVGTRLSGKSQHVANIMYLRDVRRWGMRLAFDSMVEVEVTNVVVSFFRGCGDDPDGMDDNDEVENSPFDRMS